jgi:hypothetical protein
MSDGVHLLIPFAAAGAQGCQEALKTLALPQLQRLLARMARAESEPGDGHTLSMPHERVLARECGLTAPDGQIPWAAWQVEQSGRDAGDAPWAWITPCHWRVATDHIAMANPQQLQLDPRGSQALLAAMQPYFEQDGIRLEYDAPTRWLARADIFRGLATASLDRVAGRVIDPWMPRSEQAKTLRRLQQEMQMLLYTHPVNDERGHGGLLPVNSFWISGTGALPPGRKAAPASGLQVAQDLRDAALLEDWPAWAAAWQQLDAREGPRLAQALDAGKPAALTLCGERSAQTWRNAPGGLRHRIQSLFGRQPASTALQQL